MIEEVLEHTVPEESEEKKGWIASILDWILTLIVIGGLLVLIRMFVFIPFTVQGPSMEPNLHDREFIYVDKLSPLVTGEYYRGQVIVFTPPQERMVQTPGLMCLVYKVKNIIFFENKENPCLVQASFVKRVIGVPGDTVEVRNGNVWVTPAGGIESKVSEDFLMEENKNKTCVPAGSCASMFSLPSEEGKKFGVVPENMYFVMGDNRLNSSDSRAGTWGSPFVEEDHISGVVRMVYLTPPAIQQTQSRITNIINSLLAVPFSFSGVRWIATQDLL